jgi:probable addiction module antidote protein
MPKKGKKHPLTVSYHDELIKDLKNPEEAEAYLAVALEDEECPEMFLVALRNVAEAHGWGMSKLSAKTKLNRENLYRMLSKKGNPKMDNISAVLGALGFQLTVKLKKAG